MTNAESSPSINHAQSRNLPGTLAAIGQIWIIKSLPCGHFKSGKRLWEDIDDHCSANPVNLRIAFVEARSADEMMGYLDDLRADIEATGLNAILQIDCHGSDDATGLVLADGSYLSWDELKPKLEAVNIASRFNLVLVLGACYGGYFGQSTRLQERSAFCAYIGPNSSLSAGKLYDGLRAFYIELLIKRDMTAAVNAMAIEVPDMPYFFATAEGLFHLGFAAYIRDHATGQSLIERANALVRLLREAGTDPAPSADDLTRAIKKREQPEFDRLRRHYFGLDVCPQNEERFKMTYEDAVRSSESACTLLPGP